MATGYIIKVFEAQWDGLHIESVKPFFQALKLNTESPEHDALFSYTVFQNAEGLRETLYSVDQGTNGRHKIAYYAAHGLKDRLMAVTNISRVKLRNIIAPLTTYDGHFFGACDFLNRKTAELLLESQRDLRWVAGYAKWVPWLEGTVCDLTFFKLLLDGAFRRPSSRARRVPVDGPVAAAIETYRQYPVARDLTFSLFYRRNGEVASTWDDMHTSV